MHPQTPPFDRDALAQLSQFDLHRRLELMTGTALVAFTGPACGSCRHLRRVLLELRRKRPLWQLYEVDAQREPGLTNEFEVFHLPTVFLFQDGRFHCQIEAEARPAAIIVAVDAALQQPPREAP